MQIMEQKVEYMLFFFILHEEKCKSVLNSYVMSYGFSNSIASQKGAWLSLIGNGLSILPARKYKYK